MNFNLLLRVQAEAPRAPNFSFLFVLVGWAVIIYFFFIRPGRVREREHKQRVAELKKGDEVVTAGGIVGKIVHLSDQHVTVKSDESRFLLMRSRIAEILGDKPEAKS